MHAARRLLAPTVTSGQYETSCPIPRVCGRYNNISFTNPAHFEFCPNKKNSTASPTRKLDSFKGILVREAWNSCVAKNLVGKAATSRQKLHA
jgi:hypothetical protein